MKQHNKNISRFLKGRWSFLLLFFLLPLISHSQDDTDTSGQPAIAEPPPMVIEENSYDYYDDQDRQDFLYLWETDSLRVVQRKIPGEQVKKRQEDDDFWYANNEVSKRDKPGEKKMSSHVPLTSKKWFQHLLWIIIIGGFAVFIAIYLTSSNVGLFRRRESLVNTEDDPNEISGDIFAINYQKEIDKAAANGNYRLAVRLLFLRLLKQMAERNIIQYKQDKTNFDYLMQLQPTRYYNNFFRLTRNYEYSWYGKFPVSEEAYQSISNDFAQFDKQFH